MDQEKFQSVTYVQGEGRVILEANKRNLNLKK
jgi:hypothetical protein